MKETQDGKRDRSKEKKETQKQTERESGFWSAVHKCARARKNIPTFLVKTLTDIKSDPTNTGLETSILRIEIFKIYQKTV